jgi:hypothetical protein
LERGALCDSLSNVGNGGVVRGGTVNNNAAGLGANGQPIAVGPNDFSFDGVQETGHSDPQQLAADLGLPLAVYDLGFASSNAAASSRLTWTPRCASWSVSSLQTCSFGEIRRRLIGLSSGRQ